MHWDLIPSTAIADMLEARPEHAPRIVLALRQAALRDLGALEHETLAGLAERGYRFALDHVADLGLDARALHGLGVRYARISADALVGGAASRTAEIHPADLPGLLRRHGIAVIASRVDSEAAVAELIDLDISHAQGLLFGPPRPVRSEIFAEEPRPPLPAAAARGAATGNARAEFGRPVRPGAGTGIGAGVARRV